MRFLFSTVAIIGFAASSVSALEVYGGASFGGQDLNYGPASGSNPQTMDAGLVAGAGQYWAGPQNWSFGADVMFTQQDYTTWGPATLSTVSVMATARYAFPPSGGVTPYVGAGLGAINVTYDEPGATFLNGSDMVPGGQIEFGARVQLPSFDLFGALKYQDAFDPAVIEGEYVEYDSLSLLTGISW